MDTIVLKFGGSSVADNIKLNIVAEKIINFYNQGNKIIVVVSAQGKTTDRLVKEALELNKVPNDREMDVLLSSGEQVSISKLSILLNNPEKPFCIILGGAKVSDKIGIISNLIEKVDNIIIVGAMAFTFLKAEGINVGKSLIDEENIEYSKNLLDKYSDKIILPVDVYVSDKIDSNDKVLKNINEIGNDDIAFDIGPKTIENIDNILKLTKTVFLNGPAGAFEYDNFSYGTKEVLKSLKNSSAKVIIGGGDSASAAIKFGYKNSFYHISTGGGASLEFLSGKDIPGFENIGE